MLKDELERQMEDLAAKKKVLQGQILTIDTKVAGLQQAVALVLKTPEIQELVDLLNISVKVPT